MVWAVLFKFGYFVAQAQGKFANMLNCLHPSQVILHPDRADGTKQFWVIHECPFCTFAIHLEKVDGSTRTSEYGLE